MCATKLLNAEPLLEAVRMAAGYNLIVIDNNLEVSP